MVNLENETIQIEGEPVKIKEFKVWWSGPTGLVPTLELARTMHKILNIDEPFFMVWAPKCIAVAENGQYEVIT
jgi:hypothetical protein